MENGVDGSVPLQYASIRILPVENRYEAYASYDDKVEGVANGALDCLLPYIPALKDLSEKGSSSDLKVQILENLQGSKWFTSTTFKRFLNVVNSTNLTNITKAIREEMSQLEEARKFQISISSQGHRDHSGATGPVAKPCVDNESSDATRNELLRAMDLRLTALRGELAAAFAQVASTFYSFQEISDISEFSQVIGAIELENALNEVVATSQPSWVNNSPCKSRSSSTVNLRNTSGTTKENTLMAKTTNGDVPVKYSVSPAKVAQIERHDSTESDDSSESGVEEQVSAERSRGLLRSASRRRSASPMRRVQIGKSGARRAAALTIKSLNYLPVREKVLSYGDTGENGIDEEGNEQPAKKPEGEVRRMTVQDRINLFESKQRDQAAEIEKRRSLATISIGMNKSVLRRWSAGMGEPSSQQEANKNEDADTQNSGNEHVGIPNSSVDVESESPINHHVVETVEDKSERGDTKASDHIDSESEHEPVIEEETNEKLAASAEWNQQKEAELNQMMMKSKLAANKPQVVKVQDCPNEQRGGFYDQYRRKRDEKLRGENAGKRAEMQAKFKAMQDTLNERKAEMASTNTSDSRKRNSVKKPQKSTKMSSQPAKPVKESIKETSNPSAAKKPSSRTSALPAMRKSWPSAPAPRTSGISPARTPGLSSASTTPTRRKSLPQPVGAVPTVSRPKPKSEKSQVQKKNVKETQINERSSKSLDNRKVQSAAKTSRATKPRSTAGSADGSEVVSAKPSFYNKVTKKSSVVPLESKPSKPLELKPSRPLRKSPRTETGTVPSVKKKSTQSEESVTNYESVREEKKAEQISVASEQVNHCNEEDMMSGSALNASVEPETQEASYQESSEADNFGQVVQDVEHNLKDMAESSDVQPEEEPSISPTAWVEIEVQQEPPNSFDQHPIETVADIVPVESSSPRVRHSLSQMLQEESSEADITEWGNAENPPSMIYQRDAPKGLKRLLKFARKSKGDGNTSGWSSPSVYSEGEDDTEDLRASRGRSSDNLLKAALHAKNFGQQKTFAYEGYERNFDDEQASRTLAAVPATKATRSFFSLSAFRGSKPNETKFR